MDYYDGSAYPTRHDHDTRTTDARDDHDTRTTVTSCDHDTYTTNALSARNDYGEVLDAREGCSGTGSSASGIVLG